MLLVTGREPGCRVDVPTSLPLQPGLFLDVLTEDITGGNRGIFSASAILTAWVPYLHREGRR